MSGDRAPKNCRGSRVSQDASQGVRVEVDQNLCVGSAECVRLLSEVFALDRTQGIARADSPVDPAFLDDLPYVIDSCPTGAIRLA